MVESANVIGTRSVSAFSVAMPKKLAFIGCTEKYLFRLYLGSRGVQFVTCGVTSLSTRDGNEPDRRASPVRPRFVAGAAEPRAARRARNFPARPRCRRHGRAA